MRLLSFFIVLLFALNSPGQAKVDSLLQLCQKAGDTEKTKIYLELAKLTVKDSALSNSYNQKAFQLAVAHKQLPEQAQSVYFSGRICSTARDFNNAIKHYEKAIPLFQQLKDTMGMADCFRYIGISNFNMSKSQEAITSYLEGLKLTKRNQDFTAELLGNIGLVHNEMDNFTEAIKYFRQALSINQSIRDTASMAVNYDCLGATYSRLKKSDSSLVNYHKALRFFKKIRKDDRYAVSLSNMGWILQQYPDSLNKAINYFNQAWSKFQELGWVYYEPNIQFGIANILGKQGKLDESIAAYKKSIELANKYKREFFLKTQLYQGLTELYQQKGDYKHALEAHLVFSQYNDSAVQKEKFERIATLEKQYETEKKQNEINQLQAKHILTDIQLQKNKQLKMLGFVTASLLLVLILFVLNRYLDKAKSNKLLESKNRMIEKSENELKLLNASKNKFFSIIAHDLKNPFHTVMGYSYLLSKDYNNFTEEERRKFADDIHHSTNNIFRLLQNLLEWSRSQTGRLTFTPREIELKLVVDSSVSVLRSLADQKNIRIEMNFDDNLMLFADPQMIETVLRNLVNNAIKFTPENGLIQVAATQTDGQITICVKDSGIGISQEDAQTLFKIDSTVKRKGTNNEDGSGLGLILCREFIAKNNGTIWVSSAAGEGSSFFFTVPARVCLN
jgi:signal transduction histidine kinase